MKHAKQVARSLVLAVIASGLVAGAQAHAQEWKKSIKTIQIGFLSGENEKERKSKNEPFRDYLQKNLGVEVKIFTASSYAGVIQPLRQTRSNSHFWDHPLMPRPGRLPKAKWSLCSRVLKRTARLAIFRSLR